MNDIERGVVIVGSGAAGHSCARTLRSLGFTGLVRVVNGEGGAPINRTLVDKGVLPGLLTGGQIALPALADVEVVDARAVRLRAHDGAVVLDDGSELRGDALVLASGSIPRELDATVEVDPAIRPHLLHGVRDAQRLRDALPDPQRAKLIIIGAGFIGAELASHYAGVGARVTLIGRSALPLRGAVGGDIAARLAELHRSRVDARLGLDVRAVRRGGSGVVVELADGSEVTGDAVAIAAGSRPDLDWAGFGDAAAVDDRLRAARWPGVYASGGAAAPMLAGTHVRIDHWDAAVAQGAHVAKTVLHDLGLGEDPGAYVARTGFTLMVHGAVVAARGTRRADAVETTTALDGGGMLTEFAAPDGTLTGVAGWNAGPQLQQVAARL